MTNPVSTSRRAGLAIAMAGLALMICAAPAMAKYVSISGTHSKDEIKTSCDAVGGTMIQGEGGKGYGCFNQNKQTVVTCNNAGECGGWVPGRTISQPDIRGIAPVPGGLIGAL